MMEKLLIFFSGRYKTKELPVFKNVNILKKNIKDDIKSNRVID